ncbi:hypothetical protein B9Z55_011338 [Caenorhabditis nigoni]|uniref:Skp1-related protein n=1 Tax=Caenorhabditis nigoni TaxID=1611254 RepID=A0A2G5UJN0_9PELO|nr:hypothetical protein B9Z55_011338 [Caenorhabditis nigoni]
MADQAAPAAQPAPAAAPKPEPSFYFNLESCDKEIVQISDLAVPQMITIHNLVSGLGYDAEKAAKDVLPIDNVTGATLKRAVAWCEHHRGEVIPEEKTESFPRQTTIPEWDMNFLKELGDEEVQALTLAVNYLEIKQLLRYCCKKIAMMAQGKTPDELRVIFEIPTDEEDAIAEKELKERLEREAKEEAEKQIVEGPSTSTGKR